MKNKLNFVFIAFGIFLLVHTTAFAHEPTNLVLQKKAIIKYYESGEYNKDTKKIINDAHNYLADRIKRNLASQKKLAMVLDIDDTSLYSFPLEKQMDFGGIHEDIVKNYAKNYFQAIPETLELYKFAKQNNVVVFFVTSRQQKDCPHTAKVLNQAGYYNWQGLFCKPNDYAQKYNSIIPFKSAMRKYIASQGYDIALNIGDQYSDLAGGYADQTYKLPNPMYFIP